MTTQEFIAATQKKATLACEKKDALSVPVKLLDQRFAFGRHDFQVTPIGGTGTTWVESDRVTLK